MAIVKPLINYGGKLKELQAGDTLPGGSSITLITGTAVIDFGNEENSVIETILSATITTADFKGFSYIPIDTTETSLEDFSLNGVSFTIENIVDGVSFDIRGTANNNATGNYTINYTIII